jgi:hypothetical protein
MTDDSGSWSQWAISAESATSESKSLAKQQEGTIQRPSQYNPIPAVKALILDFINPATNDSDMVEVSTLFIGDAPKASLAQLERTVRTLWKDARTQTLLVSIQRDTGVFSNVRTDVQLNAVLFELAKKRTGMVSMRVTVQSKRERAESTPPSDEKDSKCAKSEQSAVTTLVPIPGIEPTPETRADNALKEGVSEEMDDEEQPERALPEAVVHDSSVGREEADVDKQLNEELPGAVVQDSNAKRKHFVDNGEPYSSDSSDGEDELDDKDNGTAYDSHEDDWNSVSSKDIGAGQDGAPFTGFRNLLNEEEKRVEESEDQDDEIDWGGPGMDAEKETANKDKFTSTMYYGGLHGEHSRLARISMPMLKLVREYLPLLNQTVLVQTDGISIPNWDLRSDFEVSPYQLFAAVWAFSRSRAGVCPGGIIADAPGAGKTVELILVFLLDYFHYQNVVEVELFRRAVKEIQIEGRGKPSHLVEDAPADSKCPSADLQPIACWCEPGNKHLYKFPRQRGVALAFTPNAGLRSILGDARKMFENADIMRRPIPPRIAIHADGYKNNALFGCLTEGEKAAIAKLPNWQGRENEETRDRRYKVGSHWRELDWKVTGYKIFGSGFVRPGEVPRDFFGPDAEYYEADTHSAAVLIVTTRGSYNHQVKDAFTITRYSEWNYKGMKTPKQWSSPYLCLQVAVVLWDEVHKDQQGAVLPTLIKDIGDDYEENYGVRASVWGLSGTPDNGNPLLPLVLLVDTLRTKRWDDINSNDEELGGLKGLTAEKVQEMKGLVTRLSSRAKISPADAVRDPRYNELVEFISKTVPSVQIRRTHKDTWFDGKMVIPKKCRIDFSVIRCDASDDEKTYIQLVEGQVKSEVERCYQEAYADWMRNPNRRPDDQPARKSPSQTGRYLAARAAASVAGLVKLWDEDAANNPTRRFTIDDPFIKTLIAYPKTDVVWKLLDKAEIKLHGKMLQTLRLCTKIRSEFRADGRRSKVLIISDVPIVLAVLKGILAKEFKEEQGLYYDAGATQKDKESVMDALETKKDNFYAIVNAKAGGQSLNFHAANHVIIWEPSHQMNQVIQMKGRVDRRGQDELMVYGYLLTNEASSIERRMSRSTTFAQGLLDAIAEPAGRNGPSGLGSAADPLEVD